MKKHPFYLLALLLLLSACKQQGEAMIKLTINNAGNERADDGAIVYFVPATTEPNNYLAAYLQAEKANKDIDIIEKQALYHYYYLVADSVSNSYYPAGKHPLKGIRDYELSIASHTYLRDSLSRLYQYKSNLLQQLSDSARQQINRLATTGNKQPCDATGVCHTTLPPGKYHLLIQTNNCRHTCRDSALISYYADSITIESGKTSSITRNFTNCR